MNSSIKSSKDSILNVALKVFGRFGFYKTTMNDIARAAHKGRRTIYTYFKSKEEIFEAVVDREIKKTLEKLEVIVTNDKLANEKLYEYLTVRMQLIYDLANFNDALKKDFLLDYHRVEEIRKNLDIKDLELIEQLLTEGKNHQIFTHTDTHKTAQSILYTNKGFEVPFIKQNYNDACRKQFEEFLNILFKGLVIKN